MSALVDALELAAWRFLAEHRVDGLCVSHVQFTEGAERRLCAPSEDGAYESAGGKTYGEAAIKVALALGMQWPSRCLAVQAVFGTGGSNSAPTAIRPSGVSSQTLPRIQGEQAVSTTDATGVEAHTDEGGAPPSERDKRNV